MNAPCKDCPNRTLLCHSTCEEYQKFAAERQEISKKRREYYMILSTCRDGAARATKGDKKIKRRKQGL